MSEIKAPKVIVLKNASDKTFYNRKYIICQNDNNIPLKTNIYWKEKNYRSS